MIINQVDRTTEVHSDIEVKSKEFGMDKKAMAIIFRGFSDSLYSNKIGSIVREITSNAFDAHAEAKISRMVHVTISEPHSINNSSGYFTVEDFGVGLSPDRIDNVYTQYGASTKRETNDEIGGFGIGAKSPLSYTDSFMLITRHNNMEYHYVIHRGEQAPKIELVDKKSTEEANGTKVMIPIKTVADADRFKHEVQAQLRYFENIFHTNTGVPNDYVLFKGKTFITSFGRTDINRVHLCVGRVYYPLDNYYFEIPKFSNNKLHRHFWDLNLAIHCDIGEISVTMSREAIEYTDKTVEVIQAKLDAFAKEFELLVANTKGSTSDLMEYIESKDENFIYLNKDTKFTVPWTQSNMELTGLPVIEDVSWSMPADPFFQYKHTGYITAGTFLKTHGHRYSRNPRTVLSLIKDKVPIYRVRNTNQKRLSLYLEELEGQKIYTVGTNLTCDKVTGKINAHTISGDNFTIEKIKEVSAAYSQYILKILLKHSKSYEDSTIPDVWIKDYLEGLKSSRGVQLDKTGTFNYKSLKKYGGPHSDMDYEIDNAKWDTLLNYVGTHRYFVYAGHNEKDLAESFYNFMAPSTAYKEAIELPFDTYKKAAPLAFALISKETIKVLQRLENPKILHVNEFKKTRMWKSHIKNLGALRFKESITDFLTKIGTLFPADSRVLTTMKLMRATMHPFTEHLTSIESSEVEEFVKKAFNFYNMDQVHMGATRIELKKYNHLFEQLSANAPWVFQLSADSPDSSMYIPLIELLKTQVKTTLLYE